MSVTTISSRQFNQDASKAKKAASEGPVFITDRGRPAHVLMSIEHYQRLVGPSANIVDLLAMPGVEDVEFEAARARPLPARRPRMMFLLDTNVVSELRKAKAGKASAKLTAWAAQVPSESLFVSVITVLELEIGVLRLERRDPVQGAVLRAWVDGRVMPAFASRILPVDFAVALCCARLHVPDPCSERDGLIAATALVHGMTVVTRNRTDFEATGVALFDPTG